MESVLLFDGDALKYSIGFACEYHVVVDFLTGKELFKSQRISELKTFLSNATAVPSEGVLGEYVCPQYGVIIVSKQAAPVANCLHSVRVTLERCLKASGCSSIKVFLSGSSNFRDKVAKQKQYKGNRLNFVKPLLHDDIVRYLIDVWSAEVCNGFEADDALSFTARQYIKAGYRPVICTQDKDLSQVPCANMNMVSLVVNEIGKDPFGQIQLIQKTNAEGKVKSECKGFGLKFFYAQMLMGDPVDNIGGCAGIGPKRAYDLLADCTTEEGCQKVVYDTYQDVYKDGLTFTDWEGVERTYSAARLLCEQATLLYMLPERPNKANTHMWKRWWA